MYSDTYCRSNQVQQDFKSNSVENNQVHDHQVEDCGQRISCQTPLKQRPFSLRL